MRRFNDQCAACDICIICSGWIVHPRTGIIFILPLGNCHPLHLRRQGSLGCTDKCRVLIILKYIGICGHISQFRILRIFHQSVGDIRRNIDSVLGFRIIIANVANISNHTGSRCRQLVLRDLQHPIRHRFTRCKICLRPRAVLSLPGNRQSRGIQSNACLVKEYDRGKHKICRCPAWRIGMRQDIRVFTLRFRQIGSNIGRQFPLVRNVHKSLLTRS